MRPLNFGPPPVGAASVAQKVDWCVRALVALQAWSYENSAASIARQFTVTNLTADRTFDADTVVVAELADIVGTLLQDLSRGGSKRT